MLQKIAVLFVIFSLATLGALGVSILNVPLLGFALLFVAWLGGGLVFSNMENYLPGGTKNPVRADTIDKPNRGRKIFVWLAALCIVGLIWGIVLIGIQYVR